MSSEISAIMNTFNIQEKNIPQFQENTAISEISSDLGSEI